MKEKMMREAIKESKKAFQKDEVPIGCVIVKDGKVIARAYNRKEEKKCAIAHAEILAIEKASRKIGDWRLDGCEMYVTLEPCPMCAGAIANARIKKLFFGAYERKSGSAESRFPLLTESGLNWTVSFEGGILEEECAAVLKKYFKIKREETKKD